MLTDVGFLLALGIIGSRAAVNLSASSQLRYSLVFHVTFTSV